MVAAGSYFADIRIDKQVVAVGILVDSFADIVVVDNFVDKHLDYVVVVVVVDRPEHFVVELHN